jgi:hypothetical protein
MVVVVAGSVVTTVVVGSVDGGSGGNVDGAVGSGSCVVGISEGKLDEVTSVCALSLFPEVQATTKSIKAEARVFRNMSPTVVSRSNAGAAPSAPTPLNEVATGGGFPVQHFANHEESRMTHDHPARIKH